MSAVRGIQRAITKAMIPSFEGDNLWISRGEKCGLKSDLDCFKARISESHFPLPGFPALEGDPAKFTCELRFQRMRVDVTHSVEQFAHLFLTRPYDARICMSSGCDTESR